jgi:hypothetical protein
MDLNLTLLLEQFFNSTVQISFPWLIVMAAVIILDLIVGLKKAVYVGEEVRLSRAVRRTLTKTIGYFWLVFTFGFIDTATKFDLSFTTWGCLIVCAIELSSTASNFLKMKGYKFNKEKGFDFLVRKTMKKFGFDSLEKGELTELIEKDETIKEEKKEGE